LATDTVVIVPGGMEGSSGYVDVTVQIMTEFGASVIRDGDGFRVEPTGYTGRVLDIEPDASAAVYPMVAAAITGGRASIEGLGSATLQPDMAVADLLAVMGCDLTRTDHGTTIIGPGGPLHPLDADLAASPDGALALAVACLFADGASRLRGLGSLRLKESDRVAALATEIRRLGAEAEVDGDDLVIVPGRLHGAEVATYGDHRVAMSFALAGLRVPGVVIRDPDVVAKTWPGFWDHLIAGMTLRPDLT
jgi:3-phosphoshikimate 1-carboxyvinyltransferase